MKDEEGEIEYVFNFYIISLQTLLKDGLEEIIFNAEV